MKPHLKILLPLAFCFAAQGAFGQVSVGYIFGPGTAFFSSNKIQSSPGFGFYLGARSNSKIGQKVDFFTEYVFDFASVNAKGYTSAVSDTGNKYITTVTNNGFLKYSLLISFGIKYYIIADKLNIGLAPMIGYMALTDLSAFNDVTDQTPALGPVPSDPTKAVAYTDNVATADFVYGLHATVGYRVSPKWEFGLDYYKDFSNLTPGIAGLNMNMNDIVFTARFTPYLFNIAQTMQNKLTK